LHVSEETLSSRTVARLTLPFPWIPERAAPLAEIVLERRPEATLTYLEDGITLRVDLLDPLEPPETLVQRARDPQPGTVALVAGDVPLEIRGELRRNQVSFLDVDGAAEFFWPRLRSSHSRFTDAHIERRTPAVTLRGAHARIVQTLLATWVDGERFGSATELADRAQASEATTSRALHKLASHGLIELISDGRSHSPRIVDAPALAGTLLREAGWPAKELYHGYRYGRDATERAGALSDSADEHGVVLAVTGITAARALGVLTTAPPPRLKVWLDLPPSEIALAMRRLEVDPVEPDESNCVFAVDRYRFGTLGRRRGSAAGWMAHPVRVWCDVHDEPRGPDIAAQMWNAFT